MAVLILFDWQNHFNDFCLDTDNCQLPNQDISKANDICFNFKDNFKILIYVKDEEKQMDEKNI